MRGRVLVMVTVVLIATVTSVPVADRVDAGPAPHASGFGSNWTVYHGDPLGSGVDPTGTSLSPATAAWTSAALDGQLYGEPLVDNGRVYVATENDTVYALAANTGAVLWSTHIAAPVPSGDLPCGNISPSVGITSTPVIDPARNEIFVVVDELVASSNASHHLIGLALDTGAVMLDTVVDPPGSTPLAQLQRASLTLDAGQVVFGFGGNAGDCGSYHGWLVAVPEGGGSLRTFEVATAGGDSKGAIWMGGAAPVVDSSNDIYVSTGNSTFTSSSDTYDNSDGVIELNSSLAELQSFAPSGWYADNGSDGDLGSSSPVLLGSGLAFQMGKSHTAYVLSESTLGGVGGQQASQGSYCSGDNDGGSVVSGNFVYSPCGSGIVMSTITAGSPPTLTRGWQTSTGSGGSPILAGGLLWTVDRGNGTLYGLDPSTGNAAQSFAIGSIATSFPTPTVADGLLLASSSNQVHAFDGPGGLPPPPPTAASPPFPGTVDDPNLLSNPVFARPGIDPWQVGPGENRSLYSSPQTPVGPDYAEINAGIAAGASFYQDLSVAPTAGHSYAGSVYLRSPTGSSEPVTVVVWALGGSAPTELGQSQFTVSSASWARYDTVADVGSGGHTLLRFQIYLGAANQNLDVAGAVLHDAGLDATGFSQGVGSWNVGAGQNRAIYSAANLPAGQNYLETNSGSAPGASLYQDLAAPVTAGHTYAASAFIRAPSGGSVPVSVALWALGGSAPVELGQTQLTLSSSGWVPVATAIDVAQPGHALLRFQVYVGAASTNVDLVDPSVEDGGVPDGAFSAGIGAWQVSPGANRAVTSGSGGPAGQNWLVTNTGTGSSSALYQDVLVTPVSGNSYTGSVFLESTTGGTVSATVVVWALGGSAPVELAQTPITVGNVWSRFSTGLEVADPGHRLLRFEIYLNTSGQTMAVAGATLPDA